MIYLALFKITIAWSTDSLYQGFLTVLIAVPEKHDDFLWGLLSFQLYIACGKKVAQNEVQISYIPG